MKVWLEPGWEKKEFKLFCGGGVCGIIQKDECTGKGTGIDIPLFCLITPW